MSLVTDVTQSPQGQRKNDVTLTSDQGSSTLVLPARLQLLLHFLLLITWIGCSANGNMETPESASEQRGEGGVADLKDQV